jgi:undecaprenyl-diphosphatase
MEYSILYPIRKFGAAAAIFMLCAGILFWELAVGVNSEKVFVLDESLMLALHDLSQPWLDGLFYAITRTGDLLIVIPMSAMFIYLWRRSEKITAVMLLVSLIASQIISLLLKSRFDRTRPDVFPPLVVEHTASFPSGHTLTAVAVYGLISALLWQRGHRLLSIISGIWLFLIALSRVYLGAHYPSDVLASLALGTILLIIILFIDRRLNSRYLQKKNKIEN